MKKSWRGPMLIIAFAILFGAGVEAQQASLAQFGADDAGAVVAQKTEGKVEARRAGGDWSPVKKGDSFGAGATLRTGAGSSCIIKWGGGHVMKVQALSSLDISKLELDGAGNERSEFNLGIGKVDAHTAKLRTANSTFTVKTPTAVAGVRGTDMFVNVAEDKSATFGVTDGEIYVEAGGIETIVSQDFVVTVNTAGEAAAPAPMPEEMKQEAQQQVNEAKQEAKTEKEPEGAKEEKKAEEKQEEKKDEAAKSESKEEAAEEKKQAEEPKAEAETTEKPGTETVVAPEEQPAEVEAALPDVQPVEDIATDIASSITDTVMEQQITNDIVEAAAEAYKTGSFEVEIFIEP